MNRVRDPRVTGGAGDRPRAEGMDGVKTLATDAGDLTLA
jgi:hypothetical protein